MSKTEEGRQNTVVLRVISFSGSNPVGLTFLVNEFIETGDYLDIKEITWSACEIGRTKVHAFIEYYKDGE